MALGLSNRQVQNFLVDIVGQNGVLVLHACDKKDGITDEGIQKGTDLKLSSIRSILNQLHYSGLVRYERDKNPETNWYTYTWYARKDKVAEIIRDKWEEHLGELHDKLNYESNYVFFECGNGCDKLPFELAAEYDFQCPDCGNQLQSIDNKKRVKEVVQEIKELEELMGSIGARK